MMAQRARDACMMLVLRPALQLPWWGPGQGPRRRPAKRKACLKHPPRPSRQQARHGGKPFAMGGAAAEGLATRDLAAGAVADASVAQQSRTASCTDLPASALARQRPCPPAPSLRQRPRRTNALRPGTGMGGRARSRRKGAWAGAAAGTASGAASRAASCAASLTASLAFSAAACAVLVLGQCSPGVCVMLAL